MASSFSGFQSCTLTEVTVTERVLGQGSYATVLELEYNGHKCAGKRIHQVLLAQGPSTYSVIKFEKECHLLSELRHPNIVEFLGVYFPGRSNVPILVMEFLPADLTSSMKDYPGGIIPKEISYSILYDVARGLDYLHTRSPPVIHRDLTSNNVLLTHDMAAKISDLGVAKIVDMSPLQVSRMTQTPGTPAYMPPEVMIANPKYDASVDEFSYGILVVHVLSGKWPEPHVEPNRVEDDRLVPVSEAERRKNYLVAIGDDHLLMGLVLRCIDNNPQQRPHSGEIVERVGKLMRKFPASSKDITIRENTNIELETENIKPCCTKAGKVVSFSDKQQQLSPVSPSETGEMSLGKHLRRAKTLLLTPRRKAAAASKENPPPPLPPKPPASISLGVLPLCVARCDYRSLEAKELSFKRGDVFQVISDKHRWWFARSQETGSEGFVPSNYMIKIPCGEEISQQDIQLVEKVSDSRFSYVYKGTMHGVLPVTVKVSKPAYARHSLEAALLFKLKHQNIIQLYGVCSSIPMCTILEHMRHGSLSQYLRGEGKSLQLPKLINIASQVASAMAFLEQQHYVHRDLAAKNVLVRNNSVCKLTNFELAQFVADGDYVAPLGIDSSLKWAAPECISRNVFTIKSDVWAFGIVLYETTTYGRQPYPGLTNAQVIELIRQGYRMPRPMVCPEKLYEMMLNCWREEPDRRPTFETLQWQLDDFFTS